MGGGFVVSSPHHFREGKMKDFILQLLTKRVIASLLIIGVAIATVLNQDGVKDVLCQVGNILQVTIEQCKVDID